MRIFIGYESALWFLRSQGSRPAAEVSKAKPKNSRIPRLDAFEEAELERFFTPDGKLHLVVSDARSRGSKKNVVYHVWNGPTSSGFYMQVAPEIFVSTPETCFMQLADNLPRARLMEIGLEFCGGYSIDLDEPDGMFRRPPLTTAAALCGVADRMAGKHGVKNARRALRIIVNGSASPMESVLVILLCTPQTGGGYGLPVPELNYRINTGMQSTGGTGKARPGDAYRLCDLYWPKARLGVEFDGRSHHTGVVKIARDADRRSTLGLANVSVITVTGRQVFDARALDRVARLIAKTMGRGIRIRTSNWMTKRFELRSLVLATHSGADHRSMAVGFAEKAGETEASQVEPAQAGASSRSQ